MSLFVRYTPVALGGGGGGGGTPLPNFTANLVLFGDGTKIPAQDAGLNYDPGTQDLVVGGTIDASNFSGSSSGNNTGDVTLTAVGSAPNANGASLNDQILTLQPATASFPGVLTAADWNTFNNKQAALTMGNLTDVGTDGITIGSGTGAVIGSGTTISQHVADTTHNGYLSSVDWNTFNGKQPAGSYVTAISIASANGLAGSSSGGTTPALTISTSVTGILQGNGTAISAASTTGSGSVVLANTPTLITPVIGAATGTSLSVTGQLTSTVATGTAPLVVSSTTQVANLNAATAGTATTATNATNVATTQVTTNASFFPLMVASSTNGNQACDLVTGFTFNPSTGALTSTLYNASGKSVFGTATGQNALLELRPAGGLTNSGSAYGLYVSQGTSLGSVTDGYGIRIAGTAAGTTNRYGIFIDNISGASTNNYGIF